MRKKTDTNQKGFSLIELILVILLIALIAAMAFSRFLSTSDAGAGEINLQEVVSKINQRRDEAIRLNGNRASTSLEREVAPLVEIDFNDLTTTGSLVIDGKDANGDHYDDETGALLTHVAGGRWVYSRKSDPAEIAGGWRILTSEEEIPVGLIGQNGQGDAVTKIGFDGDGRAYGWQDGSWQKFPATRNKKSPGSDTPSMFWAVYLVKDDNRSKSPQAVAIAVYPSGQTEKFRYDGGAWLGFRARGISLTRE